MEENPDAKTTLYKALFSLGKKSSTYTALFSNIQMVTEYHGMTTAKKSFDFAEASATHVHLYETIITESETLTEEWKKLESIYGEEMKVLVLVQGPVASLEVKNYPNLAYAAIMQQKIDNPSTWVNYQTPKKSIQYIFTDDQFKDRLSKKLEDDITITQKSKKVEAYLKKKGKLLPTPSSAVPAFTQAQLNQLLASLTSSSVQSKLTP